MLLYMQSAKKKVKMAEGKCSSANSDTRIALQRGAVLTSRAFQVPCNPVEGSELSVR